jgi:hypothetical protein
MRRIPIVTLSDDPSPHPTIEDRDERIRRNVNLAVLGRTMTPAALQRAYATVVLDPGVPAGYPILVAGGSDGDLQVAVGKEQVADLKLLIARDPGRYPMTHPPQHPPRQSRGAIFVPVEDMEELLDLALRGQREAGGRFADILKTIHENNYGFLYDPRADYEKEKDRR